MSAISKLYCVVYQVCWQFSAYVRYLRNQPFRTKTNGQNCHCAQIPAHHYLTEDSAQVRIEYTHSQKYIYVIVSPF